FLSFGMDLSFAWRTPGRSEGCPSQSRHRALNPCRRRILGAAAGAKGREERGVSMRFTKAGLAFVAFAAFAAPMTALAQTPPAPPEAPRGTMLQINAEGSSEARP